MITIRTIIQLVATVLLASTWVQHAFAFDCDSGYVSPAGMTFTVLPTGVDDTANLQCAFDEAVAVGPGATLQLIEGTYHTAQLVVEDFVGTFRGAGADHTVVQNLPNLDVTVVDFLGQPPSADATWPTLMAFIGGDFAINDMAIRAVGQQPTTGWTFFDLSLTELAHLIVILGPQADVLIDSVLVEGEEAQGTLFGYNVINGIYAEGVFGGNPLPQSGTFTVMRSTFRNLPGGSLITGMADHRTIISHNVYENILGEVISDIRNSEVEISHNRYETDKAVFPCIDVYDSGVLPVGVESSKLVTKNNLVRCPYGIFVEPTFSGEVDCLLRGNNVSLVEFTGIFLGEGTYGCRVVGSGKKDNIVDLGVNNVIVGVNNRNRSEPRARDALRLRPLLKNKEH